MSLFNNNKKKKDSKGGKGQAPKGGLQNNNNVNKGASKNIAKNHRMTGGSQRGS